MKEKTLLLSLGGSLIIPNGGVDTEFLSQFNQFIRKWVDQGWRFVIVAGGGSVARHYRDAGREIIQKELTADDLDWLGIHATRLNAHLIRTIFREIAHPYIVKHYEIIIKTEKPILVAGGWKPGWSTDYCATVLAEDYNISELINMSNIDYVYSADPKVDKDAKPLKEISWTDYRAMVGEEWIPGMNAPFDPIASQKSQELDLTVKIVNGKNLENLEKCLAGEEFIGTTIANGNKTTYP
ncbi:MAG: UMP kinase [Patescibacteria group bacterium]|jgi:uridylate kinase